MFHIIMWQTYGSVFIGSTKKTPTKESILRKKRVGLDKVHPNNKALIIGGEKLSCIIWHLYSFLSLAQSVSPRNTESYKQCLNFI